MVPGHHLGVTGAAGRLEILRRAWRNHSLRRLCLATAGFRLAELAVWIAITASRSSASPSSARTCRRRSR
jgi:hypothetical protein